MSTRVVRYSTRMPDGRTLSFVPSDPPVYALNDKDVTEQQADAAWSEQPDHWQRGRTMRQALDYWQGRV